MRGLRRDLKGFADLEYARRLTLDRKFAPTTFHDVTRLDSRMRVTCYPHTGFYGDVHYDGRVARDWAINLRQDPARNST